MIRDPFIVIIIIIIIITSEKNHAFFLVFQNQLLQKNLSGIPSDFGSSVDNISRQRVKNIRD